MSEGRDTATKVQQRATRREGRVGWVEAEKKSRREKKEVPDWGAAWVAGWWQAVAGGSRIGGG